jgi:uncharacterized protein YukE
MLTFPDMPDGFAINTGELRGSGAQMQRLGGQFADRLSGVKAQIAGSSAIWGSDEEGAAFGEAYQEMTAKVGELFAAMAEAFDTVGFNLGVVADNIDAADDAITAQLMEIASQIP